MVILSKNDKVDEAGTSSARGLYDLLRGGSSQGRLGSRSNSRTPNESNSSRATSAVPLTTLFPQLSIARVAATAASGTSLRASASSDIQSPSGVRIIDIPTRSGFDPTTFDPTLMNLSDVIKIFRRFRLSSNNRFVINTLLRYSLCLKGFPPCPKEDTMLALYFYLEETFGIQAVNMITCCRYVVYIQRVAEERVGVLFESIQTVENILSRANSVQDSGIKVKPNPTHEWIMIALARLFVY